MFIIVGNLSLELKLYSVAKHDNLLWCVKCIVIAISAVCQKLLICERSSWAIDISPFGKTRMETEMPDLSHLTPEERRVIENVLMRQRQEEEQERLIVE